jgi:hypothetical protein
MVTAFHSRIYSPRHGSDAIEVHHDRNECQRGENILEDHNHVIGQRARRHCGECRKYVAVQTASSTLTRPRPATQSYSTSMGSGERATMCA